MPTLILDGPDRAQLIELLVAASTLQTLKAALDQATPSRDLEALVGDGGRRDVARDLIGLADREGWLAQIFGLFSVLTKRQDILQEVSRIERKARQRSEGWLPDLPPPLPERPRLPISLMLLLTAFFLFGAMTVVIGALRWLIAPGLGIVGIVLGLLAAAAMAGAVVLLSQTSAQKLSASRVVVAFSATVLMMLLAGSSLIELTGLLDRTNFIVYLSDNSKPVANQLLAIRNPDNVNWKIEKSTNLVGEAFFHLDSGTLYYGEFASGDVTCVLPGFVARSDEFRIAYDRAYLNCSHEVDRPELVTITPPVDGPIVDKRRLPSDLAVRSKRAPLGLPSAPVVFDRRYYTLGYDPGLKVPRWAAFIVDKAHSIKLDRVPVDYVPDPALPEDVQTNDLAFRGNSYDRGALVRRSDATFGAPTEAEARLAERETYYWAVNVPQPEKTNRVTWNAVELLTDDLSNELGPIYVVAGPVYSNLSHSNDDYLVVGPNQTPVPLYVFRVLLRKTPGGWRSLGFLVPNDNSMEKNARVFATSVEEIEHKTGLSFFRGFMDADPNLKATKTVEEFSRSR